MFWRQRATQITYSVCNDIFSLSGDATATPAANSGTTADTGCLLDFLLIDKGLQGTFQADRYCGTLFNPDAMGAANVEVTCKSVIVSL